MSSFLVIDAAGNQGLSQKLQGLFPGISICQDSHFENSAAWEAIKDTPLAFVNVSKIQNYVDNIRGLKEELNWLVIVAVSESPNHSESVECMRAGASDYVDISKLDAQSLNAWQELSEKAKSGNHLKTIFEYQTTHTSSGGFSARMKYEFEERIRSIGGNVSPERPGFVLLVDDEDSHLTLTGKYLTKIGFKVITAASGQEALDLAEKNPSLDVIVLDVRMPGMTGDEALKHLKARKTGAEVIMLTAFADTDVPVNSFKDGAIEYLNKSADRNVLVEKIKSATFARRIRLDTNMRLPLAMRLDYFNQFLAACSQNNRIVTNEDALYFFEELDGKISGNEDKFDTKYLAQFEHEAISK